MLEGDQLRNVLGAGLERLMPLCYGGEDAVELFLRGPSFGF